MIHVFGTFAFDDSTLELTREGRRVALEPQPARALARLLAGAGELVTRDELRAAIWGADTHVDYDRGLAYCIGQVRTALGDSGDNPRFVQTLPKRGFRFVAPVASTPVAAAAPVTPGPQDARADPASTALPGLPPEGPAVAVPGLSRRRFWAMALGVGVVAEAAGWWWMVRRSRASQSAAPVRVAVSIFDNETGDPSHDAFVQGLSDVVVTRLTALAPGRVGVIGNAAPLRQPRNIRNLKTLAASLAADYIILGQLQRQGDDLRFIVHWIRLQDEVHLSARRFVRPPAEVAAFEQDVVAEAERAVRTVAPPSTSS